MPWKKIPADKQAFEKNSCTKHFSPPFRLFLMVRPLTNNKVVI